MFKRVQISDEELEGWNDTSAAMAAGDEKFAEIDPSFLNALICEVQVRRRAQPDQMFVSGPNELRPVFRIK